MNNKENNLESTLTISNIYNFFNKTPRNVKLSNLSLNDIYRINIIHDDVTFNSFITPHSQKKLYVFLTSEARTIDKPYVLHFGFATWGLKFNDGVSIHLDDPTKYETDFFPTFYFGKKNKNYTILLLDIIKKMQKLYNIDNENVYIYGNSNSGFAGLSLCDMLIGSNCIALNPQIYIYHFLKMREKNNVMDFEKNFDISFNDANMKERLSMSHIYKNKKSRFFIYINNYSYVDKVQLEEFSKEMRIHWNEGLNKINNNNILLLVSNIDGKNPHLSIPAHNECFYFQRLLKNISENDFYACNIIVDYMRKKFETEKNNFYEIFWKKFLNIHKHSIPFFLNTSNSIEGIAVQFFINGINNTIHYEITFPKNEKMGIALHFEGEDSIESNNLNNLISKIIMKLKDKGFEEKKWNNNISIRATINENDFNFMFNMLVRESFFDILLYKKNNFYEEFYKRV